MVDLIKKSHLILALDVIRSDRVFEILETTYDLLDALKVGYPLLFSCGIDICKRIKDKYGIPIIGDFKIADVPITDKKLIDLSVKNKIDFLTLYGFIGIDNLKKTKEYSDKNGINLFLMTELTPGEIIFPYKKFARWAKELGLYGVQAPATKLIVLKEVKKIVGDSLKIISCGIGAQGGIPKNAIKNGADFEIIGRYIYESKDPRKWISEYMNIN